MTLSNYTDDQLQKDKMFTFTRLSPEIFDIIAKDNGFVDGKELVELISKIDLSDPLRRVAFENWKKLDGSKVGLLGLIRGFTNNGGIK